MRAMRWTAVWAAFVMALACSAQAATASSGLRLDSAAAVATWNGSAKSGERYEFQLEVALPPGTWKADGGVQVGVHWPYERTAKFPDLDLEVYAPDGQLAERSAGPDEDTESVLLRKAANGTYRVVVIAARAEDLPFEGRAEVERLPAAAPKRDLLPDLVALPTRALYLGDAPAVFQSRSSQPTVHSFSNGCREDERASEEPPDQAEGGRTGPPARCLRFDQLIGNFGDGPFELRYSMRDVATDALMYQRIYASDGTVRERPADKYEVHPTHLHFHYESFALSQIWQSDERGARLGSEPLRRGNKNGFCLIDVENVWFARKGDAARRYFSTECARPETLTGADMLNGVSVGWVDTYNWHLADQYIEISGVPDGYYLLETIADPENTVIEDDESNNSTLVHIQICGERAERADAIPSVCDPKRARIDLSAPAAIRHGRPTTITGRLLATEPARREVRLEARPPGRTRFKTVARTMTGNDGRFGFVRRPARTVTYRAVVDALGVSAEKGVRVAYAVGFHASDYTLVPDQRARLAGYVCPAPARRPRIERRTARTFERVRSFSVRRDPRRAGCSRYTVKTTLAPGSYRVVVPGGGQNTKGVSRERRFSRAGAVARGERRPRERP